MESARPYILNGTTDERFSLKVPNMLARAKAVPRVTCFKAISLYSDTRWTACQARSQHSCLCGY